MEKAQEREWKRLLLHTMHPRNWGQHTREVVALVEPVPLSPVKIKPCNTGVPPLCGYSQDQYNRAVYLERDFYF